MVMIFANKKVREYLLEHWLVYTYRKNHKKTADGIRPQTGKDWATDKRTGGKIADIFITPMEAIDSQNMRQVLIKYVRTSGFYRPSYYDIYMDESVSDWAKAINSLNPFAPRAGWIYRVEVREAEG
ncbi:unnamed protein product [marine sediment metagenome]|uniref:Uncharacterized protein n=1 Tax=marine sediment metagenome TaxID=412755 RepID=X1G324_9ZZZZ